MWLRRDKAERTAQPMALTLGPDTWSQDYTDLELKVPVPQHVVKGRQVSTAPL